MTARAFSFPVPEELRCAACRKPLTTAQIADSECHCPDCGAELGHLDLAPSGMVRGVFGWLRNPGDVLAGRYRVRSFLGKGGFAATYLVDDQRLEGKRRAVKEIPELLFDERETAILARIQHPAVPDITDRFTADGMVYLVLEFGGERTLDGVREAEGGKIPFARLWPWVDQLCDVLAYLHQQTPPIVHRDLKPSNVLLDENDRVMLIDFGIAKESAPNAMTRTVARSASHGFSPPEQVLGTGTDERSDVYALGATLYALLTGETPPPAHERVAGAEVVSARRLVPELPQAVDDAILRALELNVARRHSTIAAFRDALAEARTAPTTTTRKSVARTVALTDLPAMSSPLANAAGAAAKFPAGTPLPAHPQRGVSPAMLAAAVALLLALAGGAAWWLTRAGSAPTVEAGPTVSVGAPSAASGVIPAATVAGVTSPPQPSDNATSPAASGGPSALEELMRNRSTELEAEPSPPPPSGTAPAVLPDAPPPPTKSDAEPVPPKQAEKPQPTRKVTHQPKKAPATTGWEDFQGPTRGYERKIQ